MSGCWNPMICTSRNTRKIGAEDAAAHPGHQAEDSGEVQFNVSGEEVTEVQLAIYL